MSRRPNTPVTLLDAGREGRLQGLESLRDLLAEQLDSCESSRDAAALSLRFMDVLEQIADLSGKGSTTARPSSVTDEFTKRRRERGA